MRTFLEVKMGILVVDPNVLSVVCPAYSCDLWRLRSFTERSTFDPGISEVGLAQFLDNSQCICITPLSWNSLGNLKKTCPDSRYEFHHRAEWPRWQSSMGGWSSKWIRFHGTNNPFPFFRSRRILGVFPWGQGSKFVSTCMRNEAISCMYCLPLFRSPN